MTTVGMDQRIGLAELREMASTMFGDLVKAVVDVRRDIMVVDADLHADQEAYLLEEGSNQEDLWGINLHPDWAEEDWVEFDSVINIRPRQSNPSRDVLSEETRRGIRGIVAKLVVR